MIIKKIYLKIILSVLLFILSIFLILNIIYKKESLTEIILNIIVIGIYIWGCIAGIKNRDKPIIFNLKKLIFFIVFIFLVGSWLFYIYTRQNRDVKRMYEIEKSTHK